MAEFLLGVGSYVQGYGLVAEVYGDYEVVE